jgi:hypothetical protein
MITHTQVLMNKIFAVTYQIQIKFPELYRVLSETPLFTAESKLNITNEDLEKYLESLKHQMSSFENAAQPPITPPIINGL